MFKNTSKFQLILIGFFAFATVGGLLAFSLFKGRGSDTIPTTTVWGTLDKSAFSTYAQRLKPYEGTKYPVVYKQIDEETFDEQLIEAIATKRGPDAILVSQRSLLKQENKISTMSYELVPEVNFKSTFIPESELFLSSKGVLAIPFMIDPMVMYWNRTHFTNANISLPPKYWEQFLTVAPQLTIRDEAGNIIQSGVALGEYRNINHAKDILSMLMLQVGNPLVVRGSNGYQSTVNSSFSNSVLPSDSSALMFYTQFADPRKESYSWNRALRSSKDLFLAGKLSMYFGYASELTEIRDKNPNLNVDVTIMPQPKPQQNNQIATVTFGNVYGLAMLKTSKNPLNTYTAIRALTSKDNLKTWASITGLPPVRRDALMADPGDAASSIFTTSALIARGWLDPDQTKTNDLFRNLIESVTSGRALYSEALFEAQGEMSDLLEIINKRK